MSFIKKKKIEEVAAAKKTAVGDAEEVAPVEVSVADMGEAAVGVEDVVGFYTKLFRNPTAEGFKETDAMKAAEFFTKYYNMLDRGADSEGTVVIVDDIGGGRRGK